jgi:hypothetical protein
VVGKINRAGYEVLSAADEVFLIDVTKLVTQKEIAREMNLTIPAEEIGVLSPYGILEDLGLTNASEDG